MSQELEVKSKLLDQAQRRSDEKDDVLSKQIQMLRSEIKKLMEKEHVLSKPKLKKNITNMERTDAETTCEGQPEMTLNDEMILGTILSEVESFKNHHNEVKHSLHKEQVEKENMKKQISQLERELKKKESELSAMEKKLKNNT
ncbi:hypothetical protein RIF29_23785 [Crotalaria pallida]|uniref:Uncharacterized protein n=1 Tax=Crotalaria pallida TaxID=3830 RepID=A0AAN9F631_CROPI